jgi:peptidyl-prolyl cis-trans isomerase C
MKRPVIWICVVLLAGLFFQGCGGSGESTVENEDVLAAKVEDWTLTKQFLEDFIEQLSDAQKAKYDSPQGRASLAEQIMAEEFFYREALSSGYENREDVNKQIEEVTRRILIQAYFREEIEGRARPSEDEMLEWYDSHRDVYTALPVIKAQHIFSESKEKLEDLKVRIEEGGEKMTTLAHKYSEDKLTQPDGGNLGYFNPGGYIRGVGFSDEFSNAVAEMEPRKLYGPIKWEKGYSLVRVNEKRVAEVKPFTEVRQEISDQLMQQNIDRVKIEVVREIRDNYAWRNYMDEYFRSVQRSPAELFKYAQTTEDSWERLKAFEEILEKFPDDDHAPQAMFMIGFVYLEELQDKVSAERTFARLLARYPESDVADSARWMVDNMDKPMPEFESIEELNEKLSDG